MQPDDDDTKIEVKVNNTKPADTPKVTETEPSAKAVAAEAPKTEEAPLTPKTQEPEQVPVANEHPTVLPISSSNHSRRKMVLIIVALVLVLAAGLFVLKPKKTAAPTASSKPAQTVVATTPEVTKLASAQGVTLDTKKTYGDKYADGILPVGDGKYSSTAAKVGNIYACTGYANNISQTTNAGAGSRGPWFSADGKTYNLFKKLHVAGQVTWQSSFSNTTSGNVRTITTNDLPNHFTGVFPISSKDPAYAYDRNPNNIKAQTINYQLNANPTYGTPQCMGGQAGVMLTGALLFNGFDAGGRDAGAWEVQDGCDGHPEKNGSYHYHTLSGCIKDVSINTVIGYALDGFPITGPSISKGNTLTTADLDECHGITSTYTLDGKKYTGYHYVMTLDFPYSVSCFRSTPLQTQPPAGAKS